jgi:AraC-like DNA-binding protein
MNQIISTEKKFELFEGFQKRPRFQNFLHSFEILWEWPEISQELPENGFRHFILPSGIELIFADFSVKENICMDFEINQAPLEFSFHISGNARGYITHHRNQKEKVNVGPGQTIVSFNPESKCKVECQAEQRMRVLNIYLSPLLLNDLVAGEFDQIPAGLRAILEGSDHKPYNRFGTITPHMRIAIHQILNCPYRGLIKRMFLESKAMELITHVLGQTVFTDSIHKNSPRLDPNDIERIHEARDILIRDMENPPSLFELARQVGLNEKKLNLGFRQIFGATVFDYFRAYRLGKAKQLLNEGKMNVTEVAFEVGYVHHCSFSRSFTRHFGISPKAYLIERRFSSL